MPNCPVKYQIVFCTFKNYKLPCIIKWNVTVWPEYNNYRLKYFDLVISFLILNPGHTFYAGTAAAPDCDSWCFPNTESDPFSIRRSWSWHTTCEDQARSCLGKTWTCFWLLASIAAIGILQPDLDLSSWSTKICSSEYSMRILFSRFTFSNWFKM
jgi:hypothetical protein